MPFDKLKRWFAAKNTASVGQTEVESVLDAFAAEMLWEIETAEKETGNPLDWDQAGREFLYKSMTHWVNTIRTSVENPNSAHAHDVRSWCADLAVIAMVYADNFGELRHSVKEQAIVAKVNGPVSDHTPNPEWWWKR